MKWIIGTILGCMLCVGSAPAEPFGSQHDVSTLIRILQRPIPPEWEAKARERDDQILVQGEIAGQPVYLVTDERLRKLEEIVNALLVAMGEDASRWVVRILDTDRKLVNAFVTGGRYIYVFTGLMEAANSDDELAFVLGHELGHSLLQHQERRSQDWTQQLAAVFELLGSDENDETLNALSRILKSDYSQIDEQEADAIGVVIATLAGYSAVRGADFFTRQARAEAMMTQEWQRRTEELSAIAGQLEQERVDCQYVLTNWPLLPSEELIDFRRNTCDSFEARATAYNQASAQHNAALAQRDMAALISSHPDSRSRIAAVVAITDFLYGKRALATLQNFEQAHRVMTALREVDSVLLAAQIPKSQYAH